MPMFSQWPSTQFHDVLEEPRRNFLGEGIWYHVRSADPPDLAFGLGEVVLQDGQVNCRAFVIHVGRSVSALGHRVIEGLWVRDCYEGNPAQLLLPGLQLQLGSWYLGQEESVPVKVSDALYHTLTLRTESVDSTSLELVAFPWCDRHHLQPFWRLQVGVVVDHKVSTLTVLLCQLQKSLVDGFGDLLFNGRLQEGGCSSPWWACSLSNRLLLVPLVVDNLLLALRSSCSLYTMEIWSSGSSAWMK